MVETVTIPRETYRILHENRRYFRRFNTHGIELVITIRQPEADINPLSWLDIVFSDLHTYFTRSFADDDYVGVTFTSDTLMQGPVSQ